MVIVIFFKKYFYDPIFYKKSWIKPYYFQPMRYKAGSRVIIPMFKYIESTLDSTHNYFYEYYFAAFVDVDQLMSTKKSRKPRWNIDFYSQNLLNIASFSIDIRNKDHFIEIPGYRSFIDDMYN